MKSICDAVTEAINSGKYDSILISCDTFSDSITLTRELIDSGCVIHGDSGASEDIYNGKTFDDREWNCLSIYPMAGNRLEYRVRVPDEMTKNPDTLLLYYSSFIADDITPMNPPDICSFLGI